MTVIGKHENGANVQSVQRHHRNHLNGRSPRNSEYQTQPQEDNTSNGSPIITVLLRRMHGQPFLSDSSLIGCVGSNRASVLGYNDGESQCITSTQQA
jgi:hypothetical protein